MNEKEVVVGGCEFVCVINVEEGEMLQEYSTGDDKECSSFIYKWPNKGSKFEKLKNK